MREGVRRDCGASSRRARPERSSGATCRPTGSTATTRWPPWRPTDRDQEADAARHPRRLRPTTSSTRTAAARTRAALPVRRRPRDQRHGRGDAARRHRGPDDVRRHRRSRLRRSRLHGRAHVSLVEAGLSEALAIVARRGRRPSVRRWRHLPPPARPARSRHRGSRATHHRRATGAAAAALPDHRPAGARVSASLSSVRYRGFVARRDLHRIEATERCSVPRPEEPIGFLPHDFPQIQGPARRLGARFPGAARFRARDGSAGHRATMARVSTSRSRRRRRRTTGFLTVKCRRTSSAWRTADCSSAAEACERMTLLAR